VIPRDLLRMAAPASQWVDARLARVPSALVMLPHQADVNSGGPAREIPRFHAGSASWRTATRETPGFIPGSTSCSARPRACRAAGRPPAGGRPWAKRWASGHPRVVQERVETRGWAQHAPLPGLKSGVSTVRRNMLPAPIDERLYLGWSYTVW